MTNKITILVGTQSGTAEMIAEALLERIEDAGLEGRIVRMEKVHPDTLRSGGDFIICSSTYGTGEVPDNARTLYATLGIERPDLSAIRYGAISLGDSIYPNTFCFGGKRFDELFAALGARKVGTRLDHDSRGLGYPDEAACTWLETWLRELNQSTNESPAHMRSI